jgi:amidase
VGAPVTTFITRYETAGRSGVRLAVKDLIDMEGELTTAGCRAVAERAQPAPRDAACLAGARAAGARIVGRTNLHELALGVTGINPWYGTPVNPLDPRRVPGGSSSGSAVAVATGEADVAYGSDTGGSIRIPAACCGTAGLKTTWGRISSVGVWPLSPSFDTVGPMARDVAGLVRGMELLEPGFAAARTTGVVIGRLRPPADPLIDAAVDRVLHQAECPVLELDAPGWDRATADTALLLVVEAWESNRDLVARDPEGIGTDVRDRLLSGATFDAAAVAAAWSGQRAWTAALAALLDRVDFLVTPTLSVFPPLLTDGATLLAGRCTLPVNLAGLPALSLPVRTKGPMPASIQVIGPAHSEERLLATGAWLESAAAV